MMPLSKNDQIIIRELKVQSHIGVPDEERSQSQELLVSLTMVPVVGFADQDLEDDISKTVDYHAVSIKVEEVAASISRKLIETLAEDIASAILEGFTVAKVRVEIEKFILPNTRCVGVVITREKESE